MLARTDYLRVRATGETLLFSANNQRNTVLDKPCVWDVIRGNNTIWCGRMPLLIEVLIPIVSQRTALKTHSAERVVKSLLILRLHLDLMVMYKRHEQSSEGRCIERMFARGAQA